MTAMLVLGLPSAAFATTEAPEGADVISAFADQRKQPFTRKDGIIENLDTIWVYFTDGSFVQYALIEDTPVVFSEGTYEFEKNGDFLLHESEGDCGDIVLRRSSKYVDGEGLKDYSSEHTYRLDELGFRQIVTPVDAEKGVAAIFCGPEKQPYKGENLDTYWIYYDDMTFAQYACIDNDPTLFSEGTYALSDGADFRFDEDEEDCGKITITRTKKYQENRGYVDYASEHTYDLNTLGLSLLIIDEE